MGVGFPTRELAIAGWGMRARGWDDTCPASIFLGAGAASPTAPPVAARRWGEVEGACDGTGKGSPTAGREGGCILMIGINNVM